MPQERNYIPELLLSIIPFTPPAGLTNTPAETALLNLWQQHISPDGQGANDDYEDWVEQAARLHAAITETPNVHLTLDGITATNLITGTQTPAADLAHLPRYGADRTYHRLPPLPTDVAADTYFRSPAFPTLAGREIRVATHDSEAAESPLVASILELHAHGTRRVVVKVVQSAKYAIHDITLPDRLTYRDAHRLLTDELDWTLVHLDGIPNAFLVQEHVPMHYEYRLFVVGAPVTGAGCIEQHTPLNNRQRFDTQAEKQRGSSPVTDEPDIVTELVQFGHHANNLLQAADPRLHSYVLDVALGPHGPLMIECNTLRNSGLYASQPHQVVTALLERRPGYPHPESARPAR